MNSKWETQKRNCPEENTECSLLLEWRDENGETVLNGMSCGNHKLKDLNNWNCHWSCWENIVSGQ